MCSVNVGHDGAGDQGNATLDTGWSLWRRLNGGSVPCAARHVASRAELSERGMGAGPTCLGTTFTLPSDSGPLRQRSRFGEAMLGIWVKCMFIRSAVVKENR